VFVYEVIEGINGAFITGAFRILELGFGYIKSKTYEAFLI